MLVTKKNFDEFLQRIVGQKEIGYDTETTTLWWWESPHIPIVPKVFAAQFASDNGDFYLDFHHGIDHLDEQDWGKLQMQLFSDPTITWFIQNAKFDMHHSANHGVDFKGKVHCTRAIARVLNNLEAKLNLDELASNYLGTRKVDIKNEIPRTKIKKWGQNDKFEELVHFDQMPLDKLVEYGIKDTRLALDLGRLQVKEIKKIDDEIYTKLSNRRTKLLTDVMNQERELTKVLFKMERIGVKIDEDYTKKAYENEIKKYKAYESEFETVCKNNLGRSLDINSPRQLEPLFKSIGEPYSFTEKGNACFDSDSLERSNAPIAKTILKYRYHYKRAHTYFENFIWLADRHGVIHCDLQQAGTETGRMSCWAPNLQNVSKTADKDEKDFPVRKCFIPRTGYFFADLDYQAAEYRMMLDYAGETSLIEKVKAGHDVHEATKEEMGATTRHEAKTLNFALLYGAGQQKIADMLGVSLQNAKQKKERYFSRLPGVKKFIFNVRDAASNRGFVINWAGRMLKYAKDTAFKSPNGLIQGGVGDLGKQAMLATARHDGRSRLLLQVHDSLLFEIAEDEKFIVENLKLAMESVYPYKLLPMKVDGSYSDKSWGDLVDKLPG